MKLKNLKETSMDMERTREPLHIQKPGSKLKIKLGYRNSAPSKKIFMKKKS